jgi:hypothetical protein
MSEARPKRKFWQVHLSTALFLLMGVGRLLYANISNYRKGIIETRKPLVGETDDGKPIVMGIAHVGGSSKEYGWPSTALVTAFGESYWTVPSLFVNGVVAALILAAIGFLSEFLIRRREARKT